MRSRLAQPRVGRQRQATGSTVAGEITSVRRAFSPTRSCGSRSGRAPRPTPARPPAPHHSGGGGGWRTAVLEMGHSSCVTVPGMSTVSAKMNDRHKYSPRSQESSAPQPRESPSGAGEGASEEHVPAPLPSGAPGRAMREHTRHTVTEAGDFALTCKFCIYVDRDNNPTSLERNPFHHVSDEESEPQRHCVTHAGHGPGLKEPSCDSRSPQL